MSSVVLPNDAPLREVPGTFPREIPVLTAAQVGFPARTLREDDKNNFAPRFGFEAASHTAGYGIIADSAGGFLEQESDIRMPDRR